MGEHRIVLEIPTEGRQDRHNFGQRISTKHPSTSVLLVVSQDVDTMNVTLIAERINTEFYLLIQNYTRTKRIVLWNLWRNISNGYLQLIIIIYY